MESNLPNIFTDISPTTITATAIVLISAIIMNFHRLCVIYDSFFHMRYLKQLSQLLKLSKNASKQRKFLKKVRRSEIFQRSTNIKTTPNEEMVLMRFYEHGWVRKQDLFWMRIFFDMNDKEVTDIGISKPARFGFYVSLLMALLALILGLNFGLSMLVEKTSIAAFFYNMAIFMLLLVTSTMFMNHFHRYSTLKEVQEAFYAWKEKTEKESMAKDDS